MARIGRIHTILTDVRGRITFLAWWSIGWGLFLGAGVVVRNWGDWPWWPFGIMDYIASALLILGGWFALRPGKASRLSPLLGALGFSTAMGYVSFFDHLATFRGSVNGPIPHALLTVVIGILFGLCVLTFVAAFVLSVRAEGSA
jgi:hypothetical protein